MQRPSDEALMAYADDMLEGAEKAEVEAYIASDKEAEKLVRALRESAALAREVYDQPLREPVPQHLIDVVMKERAGKTVVPLEASRARRPGRLMRLALPLAASIVIAAGAIYLLSLPPAHEGMALALGPVGRSEPLHRLLERTPSGTDVVLDMPEDGHARSAIVLSTFRDGTGRACREVEVTRPESTGAPLGLAVACRNPDQGWEIVGASEVLVTKLSPDGSFVPSGDHKDDPLAEVLTMLRAGPQLDPDEETALITKGWQ